jgi:hypothetical protein
MARPLAIPISTVLVCMAALTAGYLASVQLASAQVLVIGKDGNTTGAPVDRRYSQITPTQVELPKDEINARGHQDILRTLVAEQGFAMRPLPRGKKGLTLVANGKLNPAGERYLAEITEKGLSVKPGDRVVLSNIRIEKDTIVFDINGGPDHKHSFLRHIQLGNGNVMNPVVQDDNQEPAGARITLSFNGHVPDVTGAQLKALLAPLISFDMKTPVQAYTDTLPPKLKEAILNHHVMVGMSTDMVLFALGPPESKSREVEGQMPFEEWIYGHPPQDVQFVRVNGNRVIRVEMAKLGQPLVVYTEDQVQGLMMTDGRPVIASATPHDTHTVQLGDVHRDPDTQSPIAPPSLRKDGEKLPSDDPNAMGLGREGPMKPVIFPKDTSKDPAHTTSATPDAAKADSATADADDPDGAKPAAKPDAAKPDPATPAKPDPTPIPPTGAGSFLESPLPTTL